MPYTVGDLVAEFLVVLDVRTVFGIASVHNIPLLDALGRRNAVRFVTVRGETGGGHMADAYARVKGGLGVLFTSTGPGAANAVPALVEAKFAGTPLLHITGQSATRFIGRDAGTVHDVPGQGAMLAAVGKACFRVKRPEEAFAMLLVAAAEALSAPTGPVSLEIPIDVQSAEIERPTGLEHLALPIRPPLAPTAAALDAAADLVASCRRPMLWLGNGARGAGREAAALLDLGLGLVNSWRARGIVPDDHSMSLGAMHGSGTPEIEDFYKSIDVMIVVGSRLRGHETLENKLALPERLIQIDTDPTAANRTYHSQLFITGDARLALEGLLARLRHRGYRAESSLAADLTSVRERAATSYRKTLGAYASFPEQLRAAMPRDAVFARDATVAASTWGHRLVPLYGAHDSVHSVGAAIGLGLPFGIGAAIAAAEEGRKAVALVGDGGLALSLSEFWTALQENVDLTLIVMNDGIYAAIGHMQDVFADGRRYFLDLRGPDLLKLAEMSGIPAWRVQRAEDFGAAVTKAIAIRGPAIVDVDMKAIGMSPAYSSWGGAPRAAAR
jgi:acetolactate synthase-1/2/3 large subunit